MPSRPTERSLAGSSSRPVWRGSRAPQRAGRDTTPPVRKPPRRRSRRREGERGKAKGERGKGRTERKGEGEGQESQNIQHRTSNIQHPTQKPSPGSVERSGLRASRASSEEPPRASATPWRRGADGIRSTLPCLRANWPVRLYAAQPRGQCCREARLADTERLARGTHERRGPGFVGATHFDSQPSLTASPRAWS